MLIIGPHLSIARGYASAAKDAVSIGANTFQFFSRNPRGSNFRAWDQKDIHEFQILRREHHFGPIQAHAPYTMNLASSNPKVYEFSSNVIREDTRRMNEIGIEYLVLHPGNYTNTDINQGILQIAAALNHAVNGSENITVLLETMPGKGSEVGFQFEQLKRVIDLVEDKARMGICMDLCHVFSSGYDIRNKLNQVMEEVDKEVGIKRLKTIHLNDSLFSLGSRKDRHAPIGQGQIGLQAIIDVMLHPNLHNLPFFIETPLDNNGHKEEIKMIKEVLALPR